MSTHSLAASYTFGDSDVAARRLELLAQAFAGSSREFLTTTVMGRPRLAVDLGCGPGYSTRFLSDSLHCDRVVGLDNSAHFVSLAQRRVTDQVSFYRHDFTSVPFPTGPCDLLYSRFELSHVREPRQVVSGWATQLEPGGLLLIEETEWTQTSHPVFTLYLQIVESMLANQGARLYVGSELDGMDGIEQLNRRASRLCHPDVSTRDAAALFHLNIQSWKHQPSIRENYAPATIEQLERDLELMTREPSAAPIIRWGLRQLAFERV